MSKRSKGEQRALLIFVALAFGISITLLGIFYSHTTIGQYCSPDPELNARIDCSLQVKNRGLPLTYDINPNFQPKHGLQPTELVIDIVIWTGVSGIVVLIVAKRRT